MTGFNFSPAIRRATTADIPQLAQLYYETVLQNAPQYYTAAQTQAWANFSQNRMAFRQFFAGVATFVMEMDGEILGFASLAADGHVQAIYVRGDRLGEGIGSELMQVLLNEAERKRTRRLYAEASRFSLGLFLKFGFQQCGTERVERDGVMFQRYLAEKNLF